MEQPFHSMRTVPNRFTPQKAMWLGAAVLLQAAFIYALVNGLAATLIAKLPEELKVAVEREKITPKPPPPPPPQVDLPPPPVVPPPDINIQIESPSPSPITVTNKPPPPPAPVHQVISTPVSIGRPHTCGGNDYPPMSVKLGEEGTATVSFHVMPDGSVTNASVTKSTGSSRLDSATVSCVERWRYKPATVDGNPVEREWQAAVQWKLR